MNSPSDPELIERIGRGDREAVAEFFRRYWKAARAAAFGVTADLASADDAAADGLQQALTGLNKLKQPERLGPWLRTIVVRAARRQRPRQACSDELHPVAKAVSPEDELERRETAALIREAVDRLPRLAREAVSLHYFEGYGVADAARFLGVPEGTFKRRLHEARQRLADACAAILEGRRPMDTDRAKLAARIEAILAEGVDRAKLMEVVEEVLRHRTVPHELVYKLCKSYVAPLMASPDWESRRAKIRAAVEEKKRPSPETLDPARPLGQAASKIIDALPRFQRWDVSPGETFDAWIAGFGPDATWPPQSLLPPGMAEGRSCAFYRLTAGLVVLNDEGDFRSLTDLFRDRPDDTAVRLSDVVDLKWMETRPLELHDVEMLLRDLCRWTVPDLGLRFTFDEQPGSRAGLRLYLGDLRPPAAIGGVKAPWPRMPAGTATAHLRLHLEVWAAAMSGTPIDFRALPRTGFMDAPEGAS